MHFPDIFDVKTQRNELVGLELILIVRQKGQIDLVRDLFKVLMVDARVIFKACHTIFSEVNFYAIFDGFYLVDRQIFRRLVLKSAEVSVVFECEVR